jgi:hypothetical protein
MKITVTIDTIIERADGTTSRLAESHVTDHGDNPRFENTELVEAITAAAEKTIEKVSKEPAAS